MSPHISMEVGMVDVLTLKINDAVLCSKSPIWWKQRPPHPLFQGSHSN